MSAPVRRFACLLGIMTSPTSHQPFSLMPFRSSLVGQTTDPITHEVDARWIMAYSAALSDLNPCSMDTQGAPVIAHPLFPVCLEWPVLLNTRELPGFNSLTPQEQARGVHAEHDLHIFRPIQARDRLATSAEIIGLAEIKPGARTLTRLDTRDEAGDLVCRTYQVGINRGVSLEGTPKQIEDPPALPPIPDASSRTRSGKIQVLANLAHTYTECARIFNPIHTDLDFARRAGLPDIILHGTATLALAVTRLVDDYLDGKSSRVRRIGARFAAMVLMPSSLEMRISDTDPNTLHFEVLNPDGQAVIRRGFLSYA